MWLNTFMIVLSVMLYILPLHGTETADFPSLGNVL